MAGLPWLCRLPGLSGRGSKAALSLSCTGCVGMRLEVVFEPSDEGGFTVHVPALPGCVTEGDSLEEARKNVREAIELYLEGGDEEALPEDGFVEEMTV